MTSCDVSVVVVNHNEGRHLQRTVESLLPTLSPADELIVVDDHSTDGSADFLLHMPSVTFMSPPERLGAPRSRNFGAQRARGDVLVFCDAHVDVPLRWKEPVLAELQEATSGAVGVGISDLTDRNARGYGLRFTDSALNWDWLGRESMEAYSVPVLCAAFLAMRRDVFERVGGFDPGILVYGAGDAELSLRLWLLGYQCRLVPAVVVAHLSRFPGGYPSYQTDWEKRIHNTLRVGVVHFGEDRFRRLVEAYVRVEQFPAALARLAHSDAWKRREELGAMRRHDDDWFFDRINALPTAVARVGPTG